MSLLSDLVDRAVQPLLTRLMSWLGPFGKLFTKLGEFFKKVTEIVPKIFSLADGIKKEVQAWRTFRESIPYKTGVINIPKAIEQTRALADQIIAGYHAILDLIAKAKTKFKAGGGGDPAQEAEEFATSIESEGGAGAAEGLAKLAPKLARIGEKLLGFVTLILDLLSDVVGFLDDVQEILDAITSIREEVEHGSTIFLQQKNARKLVRLTDGTPMNIRVGSLHS